MADTVKRYTRCDKNQVKIDRMVAAVICRMNQWLDGKPTGQIAISVEINANQGGVGEIFVEHKERGKV